MTTIDPASFYTGIVAELYAPLRGSGAPDPAPYIAFVRKYGEPGLELGCGDGDPLLQLRAAGLEVEGLDSSADMLERCGRNAALLGLDVVLHQRSMTHIGLDRRFSSIYLAGPTFNLLPDDAAAAAALASIAAHLEPDGMAMLPLFKPPPTAPDQLGVRRVHRTDDGVEMAVTAEAEVYDVVARTRSTTLRYERRHDDDLEVALRDWVLHWYDQPTFVELAEVAGLRVVRILSAAGGRATADETDVAVLLARL